MRFAVLLLALSCAITFAADNAVIAPQSTASHKPQATSYGTEAITIPQMLSYQGKLTDTLGQPVPNGSYPMLFLLYTTPSGGSAFWSENQTVSVRAGLFSVLLGSVTPIVSIPDAGVVYLGMTVSGGPELAPRIRIVSAAYAYKADTANYALAGGTPDNAWVRAGGDSVLYTLHNLGIARGGAGNALYGESTYTHVNLGVACTTGLSGQNFRYYCTVGGGLRNTAAGLGATVAGGQRNNAAGINATVGGGFVNQAANSDATVAGGLGNIAGGGYAAIGGGMSNGATGQSSSIGGGYSNIASGSSATVPGGFYCAASGNRSFAAGSYARANHGGSLVWSDSCSEADSVYTGGVNQWRVRARGGAWFYSNLAKTTGAYLAPGSNSWESACDSMTKEDFRPVDRKALLEKVAALRVRNYKMKDQNDGTRHIGPVAQDFHNAFEYGGNETSINMADADGVLLAAVQALYEQNQALGRRVAELEAKIGKE